MLKNHVEQERPGEEELGRRLEEARKRLGALQMQIKARPAGAGADGRLGNCREGQYYWEDYQEH